MGKQKSQDSVFGLGDYDQPTEPVERIVLPVQVPSAYPPGSLAVPSAQYGMHPFQQEALPYQQAAYPVLPSPPMQKYYGQPPGGSTTAYAPVSNRRPRRSRIPGLLILLCVFIQAVLLARVVCMLLNITATTFWLQLLYGVSDLFSWPARWLVANINVSVLAGTQLLIYLEFLVTILAYGFLSRLLVRFLRYLLND